MELCTEGTGLHDGGVDHHGGRIRKVYCCNNRFHGIRKLAPFDLIGYLPPNHALQMPKTADSGISGRTRALQFLHHRAFAVHFSRFTPKLFPT
jgi:hypothetical protein